MADLTELRAVDPMFKVRDIADDLVRGFQLGEQQQENEDARFQRQFATAQAIRQYKLARNPPPALIEALGNVSNPNIDPEYLKGPKGKSDLATITQHLGLEGLGRVYESFATAQQKRIERDAEKIPLDMARDTFKLMLQSAPDQDRERMQQAADAWFESMLANKQTLVDEQVMTSSITAIAGLLKTQETAEASRFGAQQRFRGTQLTAAVGQERNRIAEAAAKQVNPARAAYYRAQTAKVNAELAKADTDEKFTKVITDYASNFIRGPVREKDLQKKPVGGAVRTNAAYLLQLAAPIVDAEGVSWVEAIGQAIVDYDVQPVENEKQGLEQAARLRGFLEGEAAEPRPQPRGREANLEPEPGTVDVRPSMSDAGQAISAEITRQLRDTRQVVVDDVLKTVRDWEDQQGVSLGMNDDEVKAEIRRMARELAGASRGGNKAK